MSFFSSVVKFLIICCFCFLLFYAHELSAMEASSGSSLNKTASVVVKKNSGAWKKSFKTTAKDLLVYLKDTGAIVVSCLKHPTQVAAFSASSPWVVDTILRHVKPGNVLEVGAGAGTISLPLLERCQGHRYDGVELCPELFDKLQTKVALLRMPEERLLAWGQIFVAQGDFIHWVPEGVGEEQMNGFYDTIVSTVPITRLPREAMEAILTKVNRLLKPGGVFIYVSLAGARSFGHWLGFVKTLFCHPASWRAYKKKLKFIDSWLKENFDQEEVLVWRNVTPMRVYLATKKH